MGLVSRRAKTVLVLAFELVLVVAMAASFAYFVRASHDFLARGPGETPIVAGEFSTAHPAV